MNIIFLTMSQVTNIEARHIYTDLLRKFRNEGNNIYIVLPRERRSGLQTELYEQNGVHFLGVRTLNLQKTNVVEKGLGQVLVEKQYKAAIKKHLSNVKFDLILYSTPPITFPKVIAFLKSNNPQTKTYLLLKDIFPQNAVDIGMMSTTGVKGVLYRFFRKKEKKLYALSDYIGCMSPANVEYVLKHNPEIAPNRVEVAPNSLELSVESLETVDSGEMRVKVREKYDIPVDKPVFIYGGNLGKPQGIDFLVKCLDANKERKDCHFVVVGSGTEQQKIQSWYDTTKPENTTVLKALLKADYDTLVQTCDVGLIFLDHRFTIPNYPSRLLSYLEYKMPVLCATDPNTDMGRIAEENGYGYWCESDSVEAFTAILDKMIQSDRKTMGEKGFEFLKKNYLVDNTFNAIMRHCQR
jgi:glycosyltransferase involved in cell wall biosynthesis